MLLLMLAFLGATDQQVSTTAPIDGVVANVLVAEGSAVTAGQPLMRLVDPSRLRVTAYVNEADIVSIRAGQEAEVYLTALDRTLRGVVQVVVPVTSAAAGGITPTPAAADAKLPALIAYVPTASPDVRQNEPPSPALVALSVTPSSLTNPLAT